MNLIKEKAKTNKKEISKDEAEKILKQSQDQDIDSKKATKDKNKQKKNLPKKENVKKTSIKKMVSIAQVVPGQILTQNVLF